MPSHQWRHGLRHWSVVCGLRPATVFAFCLLRTHTQAPILQVVWVGFARAGVSHINIPPRPSRPQETTKRKSCKTLRSIEYWPLASRRSTGLPCSRLDFPPKKTKPKRCRKPTSTIKPRKIEATRIGHEQPTPSLTSHLHLRQKPRRAFLAESIETRGGRHPDV